MSEACRPSRTAAEVRAIIEAESAGKIDPADHPMSHWWHCSTCRDFHPIDRLPTSERTEA